MPQGLLLANESRLDEKRELRMKDDGEISIGAIKILDEIRLRMRGYII